MVDAYRIGEAAGMLGVRVETVRRWEREGKLTTTRTSGGQRLIPSEEGARVLGESRERPQGPAGMDGAAAAARRKWISPCRGPPRSRLRSPISGRRSRTRTPASR